jgi:hypothetical protein
MKLKPDTIPVIKNPLMAGKTPPEPPFRFLAEIGFLLFVAACISLLFYQIKDQANKSNQTPTHESR